MLISMSYKKTFSNGIGNIFFTLGEGIEDLINTYFGWVSSSFCIYFFVCCHKQNWSHFRHAQVSMLEIIWPHRALQLTTGMINNCYNFPIMPAVFMLTLVFPAFSLHVLARFISTWYKLLPSEKRKPPLREYLYEIRPRDQLIEHFLKLVTGQGQPSPW